MYLTAQHVRNGSGDEDLQAYLHLHRLTPSGRFPAGDPLSVPEKCPGTMVRKSLHLAPGGNAVLSYLDIIAEDGLWFALAPLSVRRRWQPSLESIGDLMEGKELPWVVEVTDVHVVFNATPTLAHSTEYRRLLRTALDLWDAWTVAAPGQLAR